MMQLPYYNLKLDFIDLTNNVVKNITLELKTKDDANYVVPGNKRRYRIVN